MNKIIILLTKKYLQVAFQEDDKWCLLSIDGNKEIAYSDEKDFKRVIGAITGIFNLESLEEADVSSMIVVCGAETKIANKLNELLSSATENNMINMQHILPYVLLSKGLLKKDVNQTIRVFDTCYQLDYHEQNLDCFQLEESKAAEIVLEGCDFSSLFSFNSSMVGTDEKIVNQLSELKEQNKKIAEQNLQALNLVDDLKKQNNNLKSQNDILKTEIKNLKPDNERLHKNIDDLRKGETTHTEAPQKMYTDSDLVFAVRKNNIDEVRRLLKKVTNPDNERDVNGRTALMCAAINNNIEIAEELIRAGADYTTTDSEGNNAMYYAKTFRMEHILKYTGRW